MKNKKGYRTSARLRHTLDIAGACGFGYNSEKSPNGGFLDVFQLELVIIKLRQLEMQVAGLTKKEAEEIEGGGFDSTIH